MMEQNVVQDFNMFYQNEQYGRIELIVEIQNLYYKVDTYLSKDRTNLIDMFPSIQMGYMFDLVYDVTTDNFLKFRWDEKKKQVYREFFKEIPIRKVSLLQLKDIIEDIYTIKIQIYNEEKWKIFTSPESVHESPQTN